MAEQQPLAATTFSSPPSPPRLRVHAGTTPHKKKPSKSGSSSGRGPSFGAGGDSNMIIKSTTGKGPVVDKENQRLDLGGGVHNSNSSMAQNSTNYTDYNHEKGLPAKSSGTDIDAGQDDSNSDRSLSMVLSPDGSQQQQQQLLCAAASGAAEYNDNIAAGNCHDVNHRRINTDDATLGSGCTSSGDSPALVGAGGGRLVLDDLDLDLSGVSSITGGSDGASLGGYGHARTPGPAAKYSNRIGSAGGRTSLGSLASTTASASMGGGLHTVSGKKKKNNTNNKGRLSMSSAKSSGTGGTSSVLMGMDFLSPSTATTTPGGLVRGGTTRTSSGGGSNNSKGSTSRPSLGGRPSLGSLSASTNASTNATSPSPGVFTPKPSAGSTRTTGSASATNQSASQSAGPKSGATNQSSNRRTSIATSTSQSRSSSLPSTPGFASPPRMSRPNFLVSPPAAATTAAAAAAAAARTPQLATDSGGTGAGDGADGVNGNSTVPGTSSRADSVLQMMQAGNHADAGRCHNDEMGGKEAADETDEGSDGTKATKQGEDVCMGEEKKEDADGDDGVNADDEESSFDEDMFLPNSSSSASPSTDDDDDYDGGNDAMDETATSMGKSNTTKDNTDGIEDKEEQVDGSNVEDDVNSTERVVSKLAHDVPTIPEGMEDANSSSDGEGAPGDDGSGCKDSQLAPSIGDHQVTASVGNSGDAGEIPLPDDNADDDYDPHEDDVQSSPSRPTVLDNADIDPAPSRPTTTPTAAAQPAAVQNVLAELPAEIDLLAAALQKSAAKTPRIVAKKRATSPSPAVATPAPGLPFGEVRVGEAPIFSPLSFHGGAMVTAVASTGSVSSPSTAGESTESSGRYFVSSTGLGAANGDNNENRTRSGIGKIRKARPSVGGTSRAGRASIGGAGRRRGAAVASATDGIGILGMLGTAPACTNEPLVEQENEDDSSDGGGGSADPSAKDEDSASSVLEEGVTSLGAEQKDLVASGGEDEVDEITLKSTSESDLDEGCDNSMSESNVLRSPKSRHAADDDVVVDDDDDDDLEASLDQSSAERTQQINDIDAKEEEEEEVSLDSDSSEDDSEDSDDDTESEVSSSCSSSASVDVSIVLPNRKNKQRVRGARRTIQASDEDSDASYHIGSSSDDAKDEDEKEDVLVYDDDKGDDGSYTIESDEEDEEDDDVLIYESDESSVKAKPKRRTGGKPKARTVIVESEEESHDSVEYEDESVAAVENSLAAISITASQPGEEDESIIEAEVVDEDQEVAGEDSAPSEEIILRATDELFVAAVDKDTITVRDIFRSIKERFNMTLDKPTKKTIKSRLVALVNEEVQPIIAGDRSAETPSSTRQMETTLMSVDSQEGSAIRRSLVISRKNSVSRGKWSRGAQLGVGSFGVVHMGMNQRNGEMMAVKTLNLPDEDDLLANVEREVHLMRTLAHPNIVQYLGCERDPTHSTLAIFQQWVPGGSVSSLLRKFGPFPLPVIRKYLHQICTGLAYLHDNGIIHRDIKGSNILVTDDGVCKLADFGNSRRLGSGMEESLSMRGTPYFMAPEAFEGQCGMKSDIWSFGGVAVQMCSGLPPWKGLGVQNIHALICLLKESDGPPSLPNNTDTMLQDLVRVCFERDPSQRPSAKDLFLHAIFAEADESSTVISGDSSFGLKSPSVRNRNTRNRQNGGDGESYHWPEYDKSQWPDWASRKEETMENSPESNPFARKR